MNIFLKILPTFILLIFLPANLFADARSKATMDKVIDVLAHLDVEYRVAQVDAANIASLKKYEIELQKGAEVFFSIANAEQQLNPEMSKAAGYTGQVIVNSAYVIYLGVEKRQPAQDILAEHAKKAAILPSVYLGLIMPLAPSKAKPEGFLTQEELKSLQETIIVKFGSKIVGSKSINGDNPFAQAGSLTAGFIKAIRK